MRIFALVAFVALQFSMFTCGTDIHMHSLDVGSSHFAQHDNESDGPENTLIDQSCQIHASHVFLDQGLNSQGTPQIFADLAFDLATLHLVSIPYLIEHPPKHLHG